MDKRKRSWVCETTTLIIDSSWNGYNTIDWFVKITLEMNMFARFAWYSLCLNICMADHLRIRFIRILTCLLTSLGSLEWRSMLLMHSKPVGVRQCTMAIRSDEEKLRYEGRRDVNWFYYAGTSSSHQSPPLVWPWGEGQHTTGPGAGVTGGGGDACVTFLFPGRGRRLGSSGAPSRGSAGARGTPWTYLTGRDLHRSGPPRHEAQARQEVALVLLLNMCMLRSIGSLSLTTWTPNCSSLSTWRNWP